MVNYYIMKFFYIVYKNDLNLHNIICEGIVFSNNQVVAQWPYEKNLITYMTSLEEFKETQVNDTMTFLLSDDQLIEYVDEDGKVSDEPKST